MTTSVVVNLVPLDPPRNGGVSRIAWHVARLLLETPGVRPVFVVGAHAAAEFTRWLGAPAAVVPLFLQRRLYPAQTKTLLEALEPRLIVSPLFGMEPFHNAVIPQVVGMPDALALDHPEQFSAQEGRYRRLQYERLRRAAAVVTLSRFAAGRLRAQVGLDEDRLHVVPLGGDDLAGLTPDAGRVPAGRYWLYPANLWPHKRHRLLLRALAQARARVPSLRLVLTGHPAGWEALQAEAARLGLSSDAVLHLGYVSDAQLAALYAGAEALVFPSEYEGFGMPLVEAMRAGCPVVCAPRGAIPEVVGEAALLVDEDTPEAWARAALDLLPPRRDALIAEGRAQAARFTWAAARAGWAAALAAAGLAAEPSAPAAAVPDQSAALQALRLGGLDSGRMRKMVGLPWLWRAQRAMLAQAAAYARGARPPA